MTKGKKVILKAGLYKESNLLKRKVTGPGKKVQVEKLKAHSQKVSTSLFGILV